jgi:ATP adenylyltransferase
VHRLGARSLRALREVYRPDGFNLGWNVGRVAGAGVPDHGHQHVVPRWSGDTNFMPVLGDVRVMPEHLAESRRKLAAAF